MTDSCFSAAALYQVLEALPPAGRYWLGYSGGLDSTVLLHALNELRPHWRDRKLVVAHVNHHLHDEADSWAQFCARVAHRYGVTFELLNVDIGPLAGHSPEDAARRVRYAALRRRMKTGDALLTAHHQNDQGETVLLQLLRGAGPRGLAAMPIFSTFEPGIHLRPLLPWPRRALQRYAGDHGLEWIDDPTNTSTRFERNYIRHHIAPLIEQHWPAMASTLSRTARNCADASQVLDDMAASDMSACSGLYPGTQSVPRLLQLSAARRRNVLRYWLRGKNLALPTERQLQQLEDDVLRAGGDRTPCLRWNGAELRRYRNELYAHRNLEFPNAGIELEWNMNRSLQLPANCGTLAAELSAGSGLAAHWCDKHRVTVRFAQPGLQCRPAGHPHHRPLKKLYQDWGIPPWQRRRMPLVFIDGRLAAVGDRCICQSYHAAAEQPGRRIIWIQDTP